MSSRGAAGTRPRWLAPGTLPTMAKDSTDAREQPQVLVVSADEDLQARLISLATGAGVGAVAVGEPAQALRRWQEADLVLLGLDLADLQVPRRTGVVLVSTDQDDVTVWERAVRVGAEHVAVLPDAERWLVDRCSEAGPRPSATPVVGVVGGRGGAGASVLATVLADQAARGGLTATLLDADPLGGGLDLALGAEQEHGLRWADLASSRGRIPARPLLEALPTIDDVRVLAFDRTRALDVGPEAARSVVAALARASEVVVVDLARSLHGSPTREALQACSLVVLVVPAELRAAAAAVRVAEAATAAVGDVRLVVREPAPGRLLGHHVADTVGLPLWLEMAAEPGLAGRLERGEPVARGRRSPLGRAARQMLAELAS